MATWALINNEDTGILYQGPWGQVTVNSTASPAITAHILPPNVVNSTTAPASFAFNFTGSEIAVFGPSFIFNTSFSASSLPTWECAVDGNLIQNFSPFDNFPLQSYCEANDLEDGVDHTFQLFVTDSGGPNGPGFWFDHLRYLVGARHFATISPNATGWIGPVDPRLNGELWSNFGGGVIHTQTGPPTSETPALSFVFTGSSVTWYGLSKAAISLANSTLPAIVQNLTNLVAPGFYTVDDPTIAHPFQAIVSQDILQGDSNPYNVILFTTPTLPIGMHTLNVYYDINSTVWPLTLNSLTVTNAFSIDPISFSSTASSSAHKSKKAIIGGAVGGVLGGLVLILLVLFVRRQWMIKRRERRRREMVAGLERNDIKLRPFARIDDANPAEVSG